MLPDHEALREQKVHLQHRCSSYRQGLTNALKWLKENTNMHPATTTSNLSENSVWANLRIKDEAGLE